MAPTQAHTPPGGSADSLTGAAADQRGPVAVRMNWDNLAFLHWRASPKVVRGLVPGELELDLYDGSAWVGLVPFRMVGTAFRGYPALPGLVDFWECNVRTYVRHREKAGVWFFSLDAQTLLPVVGGRWMWSLNYVLSRFEVTREGDVTDYRVTRRAGPWPRGKTRIRWRTGELLAPGGGPPGRDSLEFFLTERYWLFTRRWGRIMAGEVRHAPWPLRRAEVLELDDELVRAAGVAPEGPPLAMASEHLAVDGYALQRCD